MLGFLAPTNVGERWLGEAETESGIGAILSVNWLQEAPSSRWRPLSDRFAATSPPL
ncbi:hypothetical protein ACVILI_005742 [Mesorhizobium sp. USDA 4775]